MMNDVK